MKRFIAFVYLTVILLFPIPEAIAQVISPNHLNGVAATLYLQNGESVSGAVSLNNEVLIARDIEIRTDSGKTVRLHLLDVKGYERQGQYYELKHSEHHIHPRSGFYFMKRLTPDSSAMHLYEHLERKQRGKSIYDAVHVPVYYLQFPGEKLGRVYPSYGKKLVPHFHKKMSAYLGACPGLEANVHSKKKGFFYNRVNATENTRKEVLLRIIEAYNNCIAQK